MRLCQMLSRKKEKIKEDLYNSIYIQALKKPKFSFDWENFWSMFLTISWSLCYCIFVLCLGISLLILVFSLFKVII